MPLTVVEIVKATTSGNRDMWLRDMTSQRNTGRLEVRITPKGVKTFYYRYSPVGGKRVRISLGQFTERPRPDRLTLKEAQERVRELMAVHQKPESRDVRSHQRNQRKVAQQAADKQRQEEESAREQAAAAAKYNVRALAAEYVGYLDRAGKNRSAQDAKNIFKNHLDASTLASATARSVHPRDVTALLRGLVDAGKGRTAAKLRSYLRAAYAVAARSESDASAPAGFIDYRVESNPVAETGSLAEFSKTRDRYLTEEELHRYWKRLAKVTSEPVRAALQLAILLGGQRVSQLLRLKRADVDLPGGFLTLRDPKGKRKQPRVHELPISAQALAVLKPMLTRAEGLESDWVFTTDGKSAVFPDTLTAATRAVAKVMVEKKESPEAFKLSDLRRTAETLMAGMGISRDVRAQIQSHGLSGVQVRNYDRHDYRAEKKRALSAWARRVVEGPRKGKVIAGNFAKVRA